MGAYCSTDTSSTASETCEGRASHESHPNQMSDGCMFYVKRKPVVPHKLIIQMRLCPFDKEEYPFARADDVYYFIEWPNEKNTIAHILKLGSSPDFTNITLPTTANSCLKQSDDARVIVKNFECAKFFNGKNWTSILTCAFLHQELKRILYQTMKFEIDLRIVKFDIQEIRDATRNFTTEISKGGYGRIYSGMLRETQVAIKRMRNPTRFVLQSFYQELNILSMIRHPHIIQLLGVCVFDQNEPILVFEFMPKGSLADQVHNLNDNDRLRICYQISCALAFLHYEKIVHGDVKPENILLDKNFEAKLGDVGIARTLPTYKTLIHSGTTGYMAPEPILSPKLDVYSFGMLLYQVVTKEPGVFKARRDSQVKSATSFSMDMNHLIALADSCTQYDPDDRPEMVTVCKRLNGLMKTATQHAHKPPP